MTPVLIAGAGIGGLTLSAALRRSGIESLVVEKAPAFAAVGAGITVQPNALRALGACGLDVGVRDRGHALSEFTVRHWRGRTLSRLPGAALERAFGAPALAIHRADLHHVLLEAAGPVRTGSAAAAYRTDGDGVELRLQDGTALRGRLLVGADGLHSAVRAQMLGPEPPRYSGYTSWRGVARIRLDERGASESWGPGARFGIVPIGGGRTYWYATANEPAGGTEAGADDLLARFAGWHEPIAALIEASREAILRTDVHDRPRARSWSQGRVTLLGDAAHPMTPNLGQGGCQAIEDAVVLARELAGPGDGVDALLRYEARRLARTARVVDTARRLGALGQWRWAPARALRDALVGLPSEAAQLRQMAWLCSFEA